MSRRFHHKRRQGCSQCKRRRVKCNLQEPKCRHCQRRGEICDLTWRSGAAGPLAPVALAPKMDNAAVYDSALLGYFTEAVAPAISFAPSTNWFWCTTIPELAGRELYLHESLTALAALHMADLPSASGPSTYLKMAQQRFVSASAGFRTAVSSINAENVVSTFTFSIIVAMLQIKGGVLAKELQSFDPLGGFLALRGASQITKASGPLLLESCIESLRRSAGPITISTEDNANKLIPWLDILILAADEYSNQEALAYLRIWLNNIDRWPRAWFQLAWWPAKVSQEYIDKLRNKEPVSLIIFLYWCVGINSRYKNWFMKGYTRESLQFVQKNLSPEWNELIEYPTNAICNPAEANLFETDSQQSGSGTG